MADQPSEPQVPTERQDEERIAADEDRLKRVEDSIEDARQTHETAKKSWQSGLLPEAEGEEGDAAARGMQT